MKSRLRRILIVGMAGLMVLGGGISAFADDVEVELPDMAEKAMIRHRVEGENLKDKISGLPEDIQEQLTELKGMMGENRDLAKDIIGIEGGRDQGNANGAKKAAKFAGKFEEKFEGFKSEARAVREELLKEREALREERQERIDELKEEYPDELQELEGNREEMKELRSDLKQAIESGDEDEIEYIIEEMKVIVEENKEILGAVSNLEE